MRKRNSEEVLEILIKLLLSYIDELYEYKDIEKAQFEYGERTAYTECLEWIQEWK